MNNDHKIYTVSEATDLLKSVIETNIPPIWVEGEISSWIKAASGHAYFTLKDEQSQLPSVIWKQTAASLLFKPDEGMKVRISGRLSIYERSGKYQLIATQIQPIGVGDLYQQFELLKKRLSEEGLFEESHKKTIPIYPFKIGVVTSADGAIISDIKSVLNRRAPYVEIILESTRVQGEGAAEEIAAAIKSLDRSKKIDLMIVGRGGGSIEDLWAFNEETVARAIYDANTPIISSIGHEVDYTIADFVADLRAPTPSAAAELAAPKMDDILRHISEKRESLENLILEQIREIERSMDSYDSTFSIDWLDYILTEEKSKISNYYTTMLNHQEHFLNILDLRSEALEGNLESLNPRSVMERGYSIVNLGSTDAIISSFDQVKRDDKINIILHKGKIKGVVEEVSDELQ